MRITALNPPFLKNFSRGQRSPAVTRSGTLYFPIWLAYATGALEQAGHELDLIDAVASNLTLEQVVDRIDSFDPGLIILETSTPSIESDVETADLLTGPGRFTVLVGTHPSALPSETISLGSIFHAVVIGEYELPLLELARRLESGIPIAGVPGLSLRDRGVSSPPAQKCGLLSDLDSLPFVSSVYDRHLDVSRYNNPNALHPQVMVMGGRGCPHGCSFCVFPQTLQGRAMRYRSIENIVAEMRWVEDNLGYVRAVFFEDDTISVNRERLRKLACAIREEGLTISWTANMRADVDFDTLLSCREAGLRSVCVGFESGSDLILQTMRKAITTTTMRQFARSARKAGILVHGCFMVGIPGETGETMEQTLEFALDLDPDTAQFYPLMVYPGTEAYREAAAKGHLTGGPWRNWLTVDGLHNCVVRTESLSSRELVDFCDHARRRFYLRPRYLLRKAWHCFVDADERRRTLKAFGTFRKYIFRRSRREA
jgi:radical SAM superfamily enzyme YgiQ (UPF0313 family)